MFQFAELSSASRKTHTIDSRSKILMEHPSNIALMHLNTRTMRWSVASGAERSRYYITVKETVSQAMHVVGGMHTKNTSEFEKLVVATDNFCEWLFNNA